MGWVASIRVAGGGKGVGCGGLLVLVFWGICGDADVNGGRGMGDGVSLGGGGMKFYDGLR
jgi:hypothetical protein